MGQRNHPKIFASSNEEEQVIDSGDYGNDTMNLEIVNEMDGGENEIAMDPQEDMILDEGSPLQDQPQNVLMVDQLKTALFSQSPIFSDFSASQLLAGNTDNAAIGLIPVIILPGTWLPAGVPEMMAETLPPEHTDDIIRDIEELQNENEQIKQQIEDFIANMK